MVSDAAKLWVVTILLVFCALACDARPCFSRTGEPSAVIHLAAGPSRYAIKAGDTISLLSKRFGVPPAAILRANPGLDPARLPLGKEIVIPAATRAPAAASPGAPSGAASLPATPPPAPAVELRPEKAPQATPPIAAPEAETKAEPSQEQAPAKTPEAQAGADQNGEAKETAPAIKEIQPPEPVSSPVAVDKVGNRIRITAFGAGIYTDQIMPWVLDLGSRVVATVIVFCLGIWVANRLARLMERILLARRVPPEVSSFIKSLCRYALYLVVAIAALGQLGINVGSLLALFGAAGLAVSLAMKDTLSNFAAGIMLLLFRFFRVGDRVNLPGVAGVVGVVTDIDIFNTKVRADTGENVIVPNSKIVGNVIVVGGPAPEAKKDG